MRPSERGRSQTARYGGAVGLLVAALGLRLLFASFLHGAPYVTCYLATLAAATYCGTGPAVLVLAAGGAGAAALARPFDWLRLLLFLIVNSLVIWVVGYLRSARAEAERNARLAEERLAQLQAEADRRAVEASRAAQLRAIVESSEDAIISKDLDGVIRSWNRAAAQIFGYTAEEAIGRLESLGVLAGGLAHDFNNLLTGIMGNASLAMEDPGDPAEAHERLSAILQASERAALLIRQMLAYAGKGQFVIEPLDISAQVREILPLLRTSIPKMVELELRLADGLPPVEADRAQIQQLIMNLALNGSEAIVDRAGTVTLTTSARVTDAESQVLLEVSDTGAGMTDEVKARIFDPFFTTKFTGRGLGLSAVTGIIRAHRGSISVASEPGKGTAFTVVLPACSGAAAEATPAAETELRGYGKVLVVDDEELVRNMARFTLERYGYDVEIACDGREAVEKFAARPDAFAAVLLDLTMPVMRGEDAMNAIRQLRSDVQVVVSSGYAEVDAMARFADLAPAGFLQKPYTATALARKMKQAVRLPRGR